MGMQNNAFKKKNDAEDAVVTGTDIVNAAFSPAAARDTPQT